MTQPHSYTLEIRYLHKPPEVRKIEAARVVIGRDGGDIVLRDPQASAAHAEIEFQNGQIVVRDLGSTNGTWLGQRSLPQFALSPGQLFRCGDTYLRLLDIVGGQQLVAGRTVMRDASELGPMPSAPASPGPAPAPLSTAPRPPAAPSSAAASKPSPGLIAGAVVGVLALASVVGVGGWYLFLRDDEPVARSEVDETPPVPDLPAEADTGTTGEPEALVPDDPDLGELYRKVGAATVVVRVPGSVGSGVVIDPRGVILTNHHVIDGGTREGLSLKAKVVFGDYSEEMRTFEPRHEQVEAWVTKLDKDHDLALLQLVDPPDDLAHVPIATEAPYPGQRIAALGHAGAGMLWALKAGEISATGSLSGHTDLLLDAHEGDREYLEEAKERFEKMGRVIQSTAKILPGDSGGPLVNLASEIVGVNAFVRTDHATNQWLSFHVHHAEITKFVDPMPTRPLAVLPDPWDHASGLSRVEDADLDGNADVFLLSGNAHAATDYEWATWGLMIDLDGDGLEGDRSPTTVNAKIDEVVKAEQFDAEFAVLREPGGATHYWYDRAGSGHFDLYLVDEYGLGKPNAAWSLDELGGADKLDDIELDDGLQPELFTDANLRARFEAIGAAVFPGQVEPGAKRSDTLPAPSHELEGTVEFVDGDGDGLNDTLIETGAFDTRVFLDLDQSSIGRTTDIESLKVLHEVAGVDAELALIIQGSTAWVWYELDDDGVFDLVLLTHDHGGGVADEAYMVSGDPMTASARTLTPAPDYVGRRLMRPGLLPPDLAERLAANSRADWTADASDDALASFPSLARSEHASILVDGRVAQITDLGHDLTLIDVDGDSSEGAARDVAARVRSGDYDAEFGLLQRNGAMWAFYDRYNNGRFDWIAVSLDADGDTASHVYAIDGRSARLRDDKANSPLIDPSLFADASLRDGFADLAAKHLDVRP